MSKSSHKKHSYGGSGKDQKKKSKETELFDQTLNIIVYRGDPVDVQSTRHTAFFIEYADGSNLITHAVGAHGFFEHAEKWNTQPTESRNFERLIPIITMRTREERDLTVREILYNVPVNNEERSWNCQSWIGDGLRALSGLISAEIATNAADQMATVLLEAPDEDTWEE
ncbi:hypothetical protein IFR04_000288 [Cadophora malorum]|uniref:Uncharacterized protein n=1 Tax=Cadophora malorum TaxID=108018 RepID=A0A8H7WLG0_9HELO|nr:hypothetical protein IFR04_000288 [Cadophora malorum]